MPKQKYYVIWEGTEPGIFDSWTETQLRVKGFNGAKFKAFESLEEANDAFDQGYHAFYRDKDQHGGKASLAFSRSKSVIGTIVKLPAWSVDAACSGVPGPMEYRGVDLANGTELFKMGPYPDGTNNVGEFLGLVHALALLEKKGDTLTSVYTDSRTALAWFRNKKAKTTLKPTRKNAQLFDFIQRAELWLKQHNVKNKVLKWETDQWGEIPADFGRK
ncbi:MAG: ribonuclease H family protein [Saprospiraceae bacterium]|jgi:ribonuclease HI|nr:ribonuclease H family protein [Saprospiraceae bacterium]